MFLLLGLIVNVSITGPVRPEFEPFMETLKKVESPICSIDVPSGECIESLIGLKYGNLIGLQ